MADGEGAGGRFAVEGAARAQLLHVGEVFGRAGGDYFVAGRDGELDGVAADACGTAPDEDGFAGGGWGWGWGGVVEV